jgi:transposase
MPYSSSLTDEEWEMLEPILPQILPQKQRTRPANWSKREILDGILYRLKHNCNWKDLPRDLPPYSTVYWHYKQWRAAGVMDILLQKLQSRSPAGDQFPANSDHPGQS